MSWNEHNERFRLNPKAMRMINLVDHPLADRVLILQHEDRARVAIVNASGHDKRFENAMRLVIDYCYICPLGLAYNSSSTVAFLNAYTIFAAQEMKRTPAEVEAWMLEVYSALLKLDRAVKAIDIVVTA